MSNPNLDEHSDEVYYVDSTNIRKASLQKSEAFEINTNNKQITIIIQDLQSEIFMKIETQYYKLAVEEKEGKKWKVSRRYSDFEWLFKALQATFPGYILPYFPSKSIQSFLISKLSIQLGKSKNLQLQIRKKELSNFISQVCAHETFKYSEQLRIFVAENPQEFKKQKKNIQLQLQELNISQSTSNSLLSMLQRGFAWVTQSKGEIVEKIEEIPEWKPCSQKINKWAEHKFQKLVALKREQIDWQGPNTEIDAVERLKAKVISGRINNQIFTDAIYKRLIQPLHQQSKKMRQVLQQLSQREGIIKLINYLRKFGGNEHRINKLNRKKQKFEVNLVREWNKQSQRSSEIIHQISDHFSEVWREYCQKMFKIWK